VTDPLQNPGVAGLAQLGRNAIDRVTVLEAENAYLRAANSDGAELLQSLLAEREQLRAVLKELSDCSEYWSEYDVPIGIHDRINAALRQAK
jgi:hypothetical protein